MGLPRYHEQPVLCLMYCTIKNFDFINAHKGHYGPFEVTQLINSFLAVVAHPWDQLLDKQKLEGLAIESEEFAKFRFPRFPTLPVEGKPADFKSANDLLRLLRNGMAHGNMKLLDRKSLRQLRSTSPKPKVKEDEIAGIKVWNVPNGKTDANWCVALTIHDLRQALHGMMLLCEDRALWSTGVREEQDRRDSERWEPRVA